MFVSQPFSTPRVPQRIISLVPSITALLFDLGLERETVGITKFCIHPDQWFRQKTRVGGTKNVRIEKITSLQPTLVIANKEENVKEQVEAIAQQFPVFLTDVHTLDDAKNMIHNIGLLTGTQTRAEKIVATITNSFSTLNRQQRPIPAAYLIWREPYMAAGGDTFINNMMQRAGFQNVFANRNRYPEVTLDDITSSGCTCILLSSEPYPFSEKHIDEISTVCKGKGIYLVDGEMFSWYGSHLMRSAGYFERLLAEIGP